MSDGPSTPGSIPKHLQRAAFAAPPEPDQLELGLGLKPPEPPVVPAPRYPDLIGNSPLMESVFELIGMLAPQSYPVCVVGPSGVGKAAVARALHDVSGRAGHRLLLNAATLVSERAESELFGHMKGAFTGAIADAPGKLVEADRGTLILDELDKMPTTTQAKLLTFLDDYRVMPVGSSRIRQVDVRIVATMMEPPRALARRGVLLPEFVNRIAHATLTVPTLAARGRGDLALIAAHHLAKRHAKDGIRRVLSPRALALLARHPWPNNVRELQSLLDRAAMAAGSASLILPEHISFEELLDEGPQRFLTEAENIIAHRLNAIRLFGSKLAAALALGIHRNSLRGLEAALPPHV